ncbi:MAG: 7-carboxy-7-deazaguanine synthase QueE [Pirellulaceae bacterium]|nr:7-carboxy-7-deazaguanine synthase QueE [Pirellulaceae bacterium]
MRAEAEVRKGGSPAENRLRIAELYASRQGEGLWTGSPSVFLRTSGCNLRCWFCDTPFTSWRPEGETFSVEQVVQRALQFSEADVVVTGGEPLIFPAIEPLTAQLRSAGKRVTIETAGTVDQAFHCDLLSISPKLASSAPPAQEHPHWHAQHQARRQRPDLLRRWLSEYRCQLKFVVSDMHDCQEVLNYLQELGSVSPDNVWLMPEGTDVDTLDARAQWLQPWCDEHQFHFCQRSHIYWYGNRRGT